jgi:replicative DNA helicase
LNSTSNAHKLLERLEQKPTPAPLIICMDNDTAGEKAKETLTDGLQQLNISYTIEDVSGNHKDANEAIVADRQTFKKTVGAAVAHAKRPDNTKAYIDLLMGGEIEKFRAGCNRKTGYANLDKDCNAGGLYSGLYILAAISSLGKTSFALQLADQIAAAGTDVIYFSLEQSRLELVTKSLARITAQQDIERAANSLAIRKGKVTEQVLDAAEQYKAATGDRLSIVEGNFNCTVSFIGEYVQRYVTRTGCKPVIFVDYLQILQGDPDRRQTTKEVMDTTVTQLKRMSRDLDVTVICISSVNRTNYLTPIDFESLKESGGLEFSADVVWGLQLQCLNEDLFDNAQTKIKEKRQRIRDAKAENPRKIELVCLKNRYGISSFSCYFDYYAAHDLFIPAEADNTNTHPKKAGRRL